MPASRSSSSRSSSSSATPSPASSSGSSSPKHPASLVATSLHSPRLLELIEYKVTRQVIDYVVDAVAETVDFAMARPARHPPETRGMIRRPEYAPFTTFVSNVLTRAEVSMPTLLATLVYIDRAKPHLQIALEEWAFERVFLGAVMVASKYLNDSTLKNVHWAVCTGVFRKRDVGRVEREFLDVLDFELSITEDDILTHYDSLSAAVLSPRPRHRLSPYLTGSAGGGAYRTHSRPSQARAHHLHRQQPYQFVPVPGLSPSSPGSSDTSDGSTSPQTPSTSASSPASPERTKSGQQHPEKRGADMFTSFQGYPIVLPAPSSHDFSPIQVDQ